MVAQFRFLILADIHGNHRAVSKLVQHLLREHIIINKIIIAGDLPITTPKFLMLYFILRYRTLSKSGYTKWVYKGKGRQNFIKYQTRSIKRIFHHLSKLKCPIIYIPGNVDCREAQNLIQGYQDPNITLLDGKSLEHDNIIFTGIGGSIMAENEFNIPLCDMEFTEKEFTSKINKIYIPESDKINILITHEAPQFIFTSRDNNITKGGSEAISNLIAKIKPEIVIFGHFHEFSLNITSNETIFLNPGPLACYRYALIMHEKGTFQVSLNKLNPDNFDSINMIYRHRIQAIDGNSDLRFVQNDNTTEYNPELS